MKIKNIQISVRLIFEFLKLEFLDQIFFCDCTEINSYFYFEEVKSHLNDYFLTRAPLADIYFCFSQKRTVLFRQIPFDNI